MTIARIYGWRNQNESKQAAATRNHRLLPAMPQRHLVVAGRRAKISAGGGDGMRWTSRRATERTHTSIRLAAGRAATKQNSSERERAPDLLDLLALSRMLCRQIGRLYLLFCRHTESTRPIDITPANNNIRLTLCIELQPRTLLTCPRSVSPNNTSWNYHQSGPHPTGSGSESLDLLSC